MTDTPPGIDEKDDTSDGDRARAFEAYRALAAEPGYEGKLWEAFEQYTHQQTIVPGALVQWKPRLRGSKFPDYGFSAVLVRMMTDEEKTAIRQSLLGPLSAPPDIDCYIGFVDRDEDFVIRPAASSRLRVVRQYPTADEDV